MNNLPSYNSGNFRNNLKQIAGEPPTPDCQAHHVLPQKFEDEFLAKGIRINEPKYGSWVPANEHQGWSNEYNFDWEYYLRSYPNVGVQEIEDYARVLAQKYGFSINF